MNTLKKIALLLILLQGLPVVPKLRAQNNPAGQQMITKNRDQSNDAFRKHDLEGIGRFLAQEATVITASGQVLSGKDSVLRVLKKRFDVALQELVYHRQTEQVVIAGCDTLAWEKGRWTATMGRQPLAHGNYAATWCKRQGQWLIRSELFVSLD